MRRRRCHGRLRQCHVRRGALRQRPIDHRRALLVGAVPARVRSPRALPALPANDSSHGRGRERSEHIWLYTGYWAFEIRNELWQLLVSASTAAPAWFI